MKRILLTIVILLVAGSFVYSQQAGSSLPTSAQTKQNAQQYLGQAKTNASQFESSLSELNARNVSNKDLATFNRLRSEIDKLEEQIKKEETQMGTTLDRGSKVSAEALNRIQRLVDQHKEKTAELESFISG